MKILILLFAIFVSQTTWPDTTSLTLGDWPFIILLQDDDYTSTAEKLAQKRNVPIKKVLDETAVSDCKKIAILKSSRGESLLRRSKNCEIIIDAIERRASKTEADTLLIKFIGTECKRQNIEGHAYRCNN